MKILYKLFKYATQSTASTLTGLLILSALASGITYYAHAAQTTSYDVTNEQQMHLAVNLTTTQTTGIIIAAPKRNAANHRFATTTGGILRIRLGAYQEDISYTSASVDATTYQITLSGVTRNICPQNTRTYVSCGAGRVWGIGAIVELNNDARLFNLKANIDRANQFSASGAISFTGSGSFTPPWFLTTAARDQALGAAPSGPVKMACVSATGLCYLSTGSVWTTIGDTGSSNMTITTSGLGELATVADNSGATVTGNSGAPVVLGSNLVIRSSTGAINNRNKIVATNNRGYVSGTLLGSGTPTSSTVLRGDGTWGGGIIGDGLFGDGADGDLILHANQTLTRDSYYSSVNLNGFTLTMTGYKLYVNGTLSGSGKLQAPPGLPGGAAALHVGGSSGAVAVPARSFPAPLTGKQGGYGGGAAAGAAGVAGNTSTNSFYDSTGAAGGRGADGNITGGGAVSASGTTTFSGRISSIITAHNFARNYLGTWTNIQCGGAAGSGGGGGGDGSNRGGGGGGSGSNGGYFGIFAKTIAGTFTIEGVGGAGGQGGNGANSNTGRGGGGAGGNGACGFVAYITSTWAGSFVLTGGAGGAIGSSGNNTVPAHPGNSGKAGTGILIQIR